MFKKKNFAVSALFISSALFLGACSDEVTKVDSNDTKTETKSDTKTKDTKKAEDKVYKVGETVSINDVEITVASAKFDKPDQYVPAEKGKVLTLQVNAINNSDTKIFMSSGEFALYDSEGNSLQEYFGLGDTMLNGDLNKGKKLSGPLHYDVPESKSYELIYTTFMGTEVKFNIIPQ